MKFINPYRFCEWALVAVVLAFTLAAFAADTNSSNEISSQDKKSLNLRNRIEKAYSDFGPYHGPSVNEVDTRTLDGKVMCGYQGWFGVPGDGSEGQIWRHWTKHGDFMEDGNARVDLWPDVSELSPSERFPTGLKLANGKQAEVFSSYQKPTVLRHFQWMEEYGIDGAFIQRFAVDAHNPSSLQFDNRILANCREGANLHGRAYAVMYDLSGLGSGHIEEVMNDWRHLKKIMTITADPAYLHYHGKPVVAVWGVGFDDHRKYTLEDCRALINFLKNDDESGGCAVMVGVPTYWREQNHDAVSDPQLLQIISLADIVSPWTVGRYTTPAGANNYAIQTLKPDIEWCRQKKIDCMPVVFPGFSWYNMNGVKFNYVPRQRGKFLWSQFLGAKQAGTSMLYVAMFDEVDEGTAIFKCANDVPITQKSKFLNFEGLPSDYYLKLVGVGTKLIEGKISPEATSALVAGFQNNTTAEKRIEGYQ